MPEFVVNTSWTDAQCSTSVESSREAVQKLRLAAVDGLLSLPRVGVGIGGLLIGSYTPGRIQITDSVEIQCAHSNGPSFGLTPEEIAQALELKASVSPLQVVGWFCSKTRAQAVFSEHDGELFQSLCPEAWQVMLLLRPSTVEPSRAQLFFREAGGPVVAGPVHELEVAAMEEPLPDAEDVAPDTAPEAARPQLVVVPQEPALPEASLAARRPHLVVRPETLPEVEVPLPGPLAVPAAGPSSAEPAAEPAEEPDAEPDAERQSAPLAPRVERLLERLSEFQPEDEENGRNPRDKSPEGSRIVVSTRRAWVLGAVAAVFLSASGAAAWITRADWMPRPPLILNLVDLNGRLTIRWNFAALHNSVRTGRLSVKDGGEPQPFDLDRHALEAGEKVYDRKTESIIVTLSAGGARARASFVDKVPLRATPAPVSKSGAETAPGLAKGVRTGKKENQADPVPVRTHAAVPQP